MKQYSINETYTAVDKQQTFNIEKPFINDTISVFVNGTLQILGQDKDYLTVQDTGKVIFNQPLNEGDTVSVISTVASNKISLEVISPGRSDKPTALYKKYGTVRRLKQNNKYNVQICIGKEIVKWNFISKLNPLFVQSKKIYEDIGEFIEGFTDEYVNSMLYRNSVEVVELLDELADSDNPDESIVYTQDDEGIYDTPSRIVKNWVRFKTEIDLIYARYFGISYRYGTVEKEVGDIKIRKETKLPYIENLLGRLRDEFDEADAAIRGLNKVAYGVKGSTQYSYENWERTTNF